MYQFALNLFYQLPRLFPCTILFSNISPAFLFSLLFHPDYFFYVVPHKLAIPEGYGFISLYTTYL